MKVANQYGEAIEAEPLPKKYGRLHGASVEQIRAVAIALLRGQGATMEQIASAMRCEVRQAYNDRLVRLPDLGPHLNRAIGGGTSRDDND